MMSACQSNFKYVDTDAVAVWNFSDLTDCTTINSRWKQEGVVEFVKLTGEDAAESRKRGGDSRAVHLIGQGWLNAGQGEKEELNLSGKAFSMLVRMRIDSIKGYTPILSKAGNDQNIAYKMSVYQENQTNVLEVIMGSDEIAGAHQLIYRLSDNDLQQWHDVIFRFNGKKSELYFDGRLCDDAVTVGTLRDWNRHPLLLGAEYTDSEGYSTLTRMKPSATFSGWIDHAALWKRALTDKEIASWSGVKKLEDGRPEYYAEAYRPQFHFSAKKHWLNDPNGLVYYNGTYHLFFQYMPPHRPGAYKDWGHAISKDLLHWKQLDSHITPHKIWGGCWSGSAVVDEQNVTGLQEGKEKPILAFLTNGGHPDDGLGPLCTQCMVYSTDGGKTFIYYDRNPIIKHISHSNRDPKVVWDADSKQWVLSLYMDRNEKNEAGGSEYGIFTSNDLLHWTLKSTFILKGDAECPGFIPLQLDADGKKKTKWMFFGANGRYVIGTFDGRDFYPETEVRQGDYGRNFYAAMTWNNLPDGRCIHLAWMRTSRYPQMPYDQQMNFPTELALRHTAEGIKAYRLPVREIASLYDETYTWKQVTLPVEGKNLLEKLDGELYDMEFELDMKESSSFTIGIRGATVRYDMDTERILCEGPTVQNPKESLGEASLKPIDGKIRLRILVDRTSIEVYGNDGEVVLTSNFMPDLNCFKYSFEADRQVKLLNGEVHSLKSIWKNN